MKKTFKNFLLRKEARDIYIKREIAKNKIKNYLYEFSIDSFKTCAFDIYINLWKENHNKSNKYTKANINKEYLKNLIINSNNTNKNKEEFENIFKYHTNFHINYFSDLFELLDIIIQFDKIDFLKIILSSYIINNNIYISLDEYYLNLYINLFKFNSVKCTKYFIKNKKYELKPILKKFFILLVNDRKYTLINDNMLIIMNFIKKYDSFDNMLMNMNFIKKSIKIIKNIDNIFMDLINKIDEIYFLNEQLINKIDFIHNIIDFICKNKMFDFKKNRFHKKITIQSILNKILFLTNLNKDNYELYFRNLKNIFIPSSLFFDYLHERIRKIIFELNKFNNKNIINILYHIQINNMYNFKEFKYYEILDILVIFNNFNNNNYYIGEREVNSINEILLYLDINIFNFNNINDILISSFKRQIKGSNMEKYTLMVNMYDYYLKDYLSNRNKLNILYCLKMNNDLYNNLSTDILIDLCDMIE